jgi:hypothetical protein
MIYSVLFCKLLINNECQIIFGRQGPSRQNQLFNLWRQRAFGHSSNLLTETDSALQHMSLERCLGLAASTV